jgi:trk system potassium uptake protein TrkA
LGRFGSAVARELVEQGAQVVAIDRRKDLVENIKDTVTYAVVLDATDEAALRSVDIQNVDIAIVCVGENVEANLLTTLLLKRMGVKRIWSRAINPLQSEILKELEVDSIINLEDQMGKLVARSIVMENVARHLQLSEGFSVAEVRIPERFVGATLRDLDARKAFRLNVVAIKQIIPDITEHGERTFREHIENVPSPDEKLREKDVLIVVGRQHDIEEFSRQ